ncbi:hypothetical protein Goklo_020879 [Gossypium klotzschianum]|uniref:Uncharacterized protein n=1 Tax=Gossypium klotzschianum TaxID=34286 RepID=A0A7J8UTM1_9ROSI|nr:hypothetical protein [Gossypium klotzschianum]
MKFNALFKKKASQYSYTDSSESPLNYAKIAVDGNNMFWRKRKSPEEVIRVLCTEVEDDDGAKRLKQEEVANRSDLRTGIEIENLDQSVNSNFIGPTATKSSKIPIWSSFWRQKLIKKCMEKVRRSYGLLNRIDVEVKGYRGRLCLAWKADISVNLRSFSKSHIDVTLKEEGVKEE